MLYGNDWTQQSLPTIDNLAVFVDSRSASVTAFNPQTIHKQYYVYRQKNIYTT